MKTTDYQFQKKGITNFFVRKEIAKMVFTTSHDKRGIHIQVTHDEYDELFDIEGSKMRPFFDNQSIMVAKVKEILAKQGAS